ncbi:hypothetical protein C2845_PM07G07830 [Panicum miliaceum]|uniref:No apical meristem-associated C-terminal domain-containing protein n=1 Tax=Panicum miliaceum TaxID=4540 RepID=A0A3L6SQ01_PANMI|nr:hypothetical protein C2845_PM07G07830 [Panicum miliaceum]
MAAQQPPAPLATPSLNTTASQAAGELDMDGGLNIFDEMPSSEPLYRNMMDDSFGIDDISLSNQIPFESNEDVTDQPNPTPGAKKRWARSANYSVQEDEALVLAWESVSLDPIIGKDQSMKTYWKCIADHFHRNVKTPSNRSINSLSHRWGTIQECCNRWAGCVVNIDRAQPSGATLQDRLVHIQKLYKLKEPKNMPFVMLHCWTLLEHNEKWNNRDNDCHPLKKRAGNSSFTEFQNEGDDNEDEEESGSPRLGPPNKKRPLGRKQEKERIEEMEMIATRKEIEAERKQDKKHKVDTS